MCLDLDLLGIEINKILQNFQQLFVWKLRDGSTMIFLTIMHQNIWFDDVN